MSARALLELLDDSLARDEEALELEAELSSDAARDPDVRGMLAIAAAPLARTRRSGA